MSDTISLPVLALYLDLDESNVRRNARAGKYGPLTAPPGLVNCREVSVAEIETRFGFINPRRLEMMRELHVELKKLATQERRQAKAKSKSNRGVGPSKHGNSHGRPK